MSLPCFKSLAIVLLLIPLKCIANISESINFSGFLSIGGANIESNISGPESSYDNIFEGGLRSSLTLPKNFEVNAQILYRDFGDNLIIDKDFFVDFATLDWRYNGSRFGEQTVSIGRFKANIGINGAVRDLPFVRPSILLDPAIYNEQIRSLFINADGIRVVSEHSIRDGSLTVELAYGKSNLDSSLSGIIFSSNIDAGFQSEGALFTDIRYAYNQWLFTFSYSEIDTSFNGIEAFTGNDFPVDGKLDFRNTIFGIQYNSAKWEITSEYGRREEPLNFSDTAQTDIRLDEGYYIQARYYLSPKTVFLVRKEEQEISFNQFPDRELRSAQVIGLNWSFHPNWKLSTEYHYIQSEVQQIEDKFSLGLVQLLWRF